jgi:hypothetical protein
MRPYIINAIKTASSTKPKETTLREEYRLGLFGAGHKRK